MNLRALTAITLFVSFVAMATSGMMMLVVDRPSFTIRMHPVHKLFGILLVLSVLSHLGLNYRALLAHTRQRAMAWVGAALCALLVLVYAAAALSEMDAAQAAAIDSAAQRLENSREAAKP